MRTITTLAMIAVALPVTALAEPVDGNPDEAALHKLKTEIWPGFYRNQDAEGLDGLLDPAFVNIAPDGQLTTKPEELDGVRTHPWNPKNFRYTVENFVWLDDDQVIVVGRGESDREDPDGKPCRHGYVSSNLLRRAEDSPLGWRALSSHVSGVGCTPM
ncbi:MAG TPA: nuclear transport factor 2 family protein [Steroidobacteraceae bacterium]|nr:nuclear transport factor 2 family protein [Steroidobacteraceae bacterium]